jgi:signal transduction histidine kinase
MWRQLFDAPSPERTDMPALVQRRAAQRVHDYWRTRGWQLILGEIVLWVYARSEHLEHHGAYGVLAGMMAFAYVLGLFPTLDILWLLILVLMMMVQGMLIGGLGAVTAMSYMLPYTFALLLMSGRRRIVVQAWCVIAFWISLLYEVVPGFQQLSPTRSVLVSYNILLAAFTFQTLRFMNNLAVELNSTYVAEEVRGQSQQFLARVSHELRTPLNSILGFAKMLKRSELDDKQSSYLTQVIDEGEQLNRLVSDLLDSAHLSTGKLTLNKTPCSLNTICETVVAEHRPQLQPSVQMKTRLFKDLPQVTVDPVRVRQIVSNLTSNAVKHTESGEIEISTAHRGKSAVVIVRDTGAGIPEDQHELIFVPFVQLDGRKIGVGLGLDIALQLARLHGGTIHVQSVVGQGSTFTLEIPLE